MNAPFRKITSYSDRFEADLVVSFLNGCGIFVEVRSDDAGGINNLMTASNGVHLYVKSEQFEEATKLLQSEFEA